MATESAVSVVIVNYNACEKLRRCLQSLEPEHEVIVVDNASVDGSAEMVAAEFPSVKLVRNAQNLGFGAANNQGLDLATRELVLYLNNDAYATPGAIARLARSFEDPGVAAAGGKLLNMDGSLQESCCSELTLWAVFCEQSYLEKLFPRSRLLSPYWLSRRLLAQPNGDKKEHEVAQVMGACLMTRKQERFDERFFLYCEDTELCRRLRRHGKIVYVPETAFTHELGTSSAASRWTAIARYNRGKELFFRLHHGPLASFACFLMDRFGALMRLLAWSLVALLTLGRKGLGHAQMFARVLAAPIAGPPRPGAKR